MVTIEDSYGLGPQPRYIKFTGYITRPDKDGRRTHIPWSGGYLNDMLSVRRLTLIDGESLIEVFSMGPKGVVVHDLFFGIWGKELDPKLIRNTL